MISSWATGLLKQDEKEQLPAPWYFRVKPGRYFVSAEVELGPNMNSTDPATGKRTVLSPAQGEWSGKLQTGAAAVELFTQPVPADEAAAKYPPIEFRRAVAPARQALLASEWDKATRD